MKLRSLLEATYKQLKQQQSSIYNLFPDFDSKMMGVLDSGGAELVKFGETSHFKVPSATNNNVYDVYIKLSDFESKIAELRSINKKVNLVKFAKDMLYNSNMEISCSCPAFQYWGPSYTTSKLDSKHGAQEKRAPVVRNPNEHGALCKHAALVFRVFPFYISKLASEIKRSL